MLGILLLVAVARQEPLPAHLNIPAGWKLGHSSAGGAVLGPNGEEIDFPAYEPTGYVAQTTHEIDPESLQVTTIIDRRRVAVAVRPDGFLAVSFPAVDGRPYNYGLVFDYWTQTKTAQEAAKALAICLTRVEVLQREFGDRDKLDPRDIAAHHVKATAEYPFDYLGSTPIQYRAASRSFETWSGQPIVEMKPGPPPAKSTWEDKTTLLGRTIRWGEDTSGRTWAAIGSDPVFVSAEPKAPGTILAIMAAIAYKPAESRSMIKRSSPRRA